jgi:hypothetical protein
MSPPASALIKTCNLEAYAVYQQYLWDRKVFELQLLELSG